MTRNTRFRKFLRCLNTVACWCVVKLFAIWKCAVDFVAAEWLLSFVPNGGPVIVFRAGWTTTIISAALLPLLVAVHPTRGLDLSGFRDQFISSFEWLAAIFAGTLAGLYSRFASQWTYLAGVYNDIKSAESRKDCDRDRITQWKAGFIEDAQDLHLATKPLFASLIRAWGNDQDVQRAFWMYAPGGARRLSVLLSRVEDVWRRSERTWHRRT
jgi:hypothetical protein